MKFHIISLGCSKNTADSEAVANRFARHGWQWSNDAGQADLLMINTCGFINDAKEESLRVIMQALELKTARPAMKTAVFGCLVKRYRSEIVKEIPEIDYLYDFLSDDQVEFLIGLGGKGLVAPDMSQSWRFFTPPHTGILKIAEGCSNKCTYCAIPGIRGPFFSRDENEILADAVELAKSGAKEISIVAQDITRYGTDQNGKCRLPELVRQVSKIDGIAWIRLHYMHPRGLSVALLDELYGIAKVLPYFDIPFQHVSERLLHLMNRNTSRQQIVDLISHIRRNYPDGAIRTTFIVGFPGEKKRDFDELIDFVDEFPLDRVGAFAYSPEDGTPAALLRPRVSGPVKQARLDQLMTLQQLVIGERNSALIGREIPVMIDAVTAGKAVGRTPYDAFEVDNTTTIADGKGLKAGDIVKARITAADAYDFEAVVVK